MYLFLDNEMGGLEKDQYSLLTVYLMMTDDNFKVIGDLYLYLKPNDGIYKVCVRAMEINKINLVEHDKRAITYKEGSTALYNFLSKLTDGGKVKATVVGHGIYGDVEWILHHLISRNSFENFTSYRKLDTSSTCQFLKSCGLFPEDVSGSLESLAKHFNINQNAGDDIQFHDAKFDTEITFKVFLALRQLMASFVR
jgi:oligoribonuclease (3'-5' exoribonuclease)